MKSDIFITVNAKKSSSYPNDLGGRFVGFQKVLGAPVWSWEFSIMYILVSYIRGPGHEIGEKYDL